MAELTRNRETLGRRIGIAAAAAIVILLIIWVSIVLQPRPTIQIDTGTTGVSIGRDGVSVRTGPAPVEGGSR